METQHELDSSPGRRIRTVSADVAKRARKTVVPVETHTPREHRIATLAQAVAEDARAEAVVIRNAEQAQELHALRGSQEGKWLLRQSAGADRGIRVQGTREDADQMREDLIRRGATLVFGKTMDIAASKGVLKYDWEKQHDRGWQTFAVPNEDAVHRDRVRGTLRFLREYLARAVEGEREVIPVRFDSFRGMDEDVNTPAFLALLEAHPKRLKVTFATAELRDQFLAARDGYRRAQKKKSRPRAPQPVPPASARVHPPLRTAAKRVQNPVRQKSEPLPEPPKQSERWWTRWGKGLARAVGLGSSKKT